MMINDGERCDVVNDALSLIQKTNGLLFGTDALLLAAYINGRYESGIELGGGTGIISMLLLSRKKLSKVICLEAQEEFAELISRNARLNALDERLYPVCEDIRRYKCQRECDIVFTNPPYMKTSSGKKNSEEIKNIARHEVKGDIYDFLNAAKSFLKYGGAFAAVYRPDRLSDLICAMREAQIEPKRMTFVYADTESEPSMVLTIGKKCGKSGMILTKPLIIYSDITHKKYTEDMSFIMEKGSFPEKYSR